MRVRAIGGFRGPLYPEIRPQCRRYPRVTGRMRSAQGRRYSNLAAADDDTSQLPVTSKSLVGKFGQVIWIRVIHNT